MELTEKQIEIVKDALLSQINNLDQIRRGIIYDLETLEFIHLRISEIQAILSLLNEED